MRPVNLLPVEQRRGENAPLRTGPIAYVVIGTLVAILAGVTVLVVTDNQISSRKADVAKLEREDANAQARAERLAAYTQFRSLREQRVSTVTSLANSRFDWQRVMRELALILPRDVWLVGLTATASSEVNIEGANSSSEGGADLRDSVPGPALELSGCAKGQEAVAGFVTALKDIDGVTRVGVQSSKLPDREAAAGVAQSGGSGSEGGGEDCRTRNFIAKFSVVVAFDAAPVQSTESTTAPPSATETAETTSSETSESSSESSEGG